MADNPSRRTMLADLPAAALMPAAALAAGAVPASAADAQLIALSKRFDEALVVVEAWEAKGIEDNEQEAFDEAVHAASSLMIEIAHSRATTLAGLKAKTRAISYACGVETLDTHKVEYMDDLMPASIVRDLLAL